MSTQKLIDEGEPEARIEQTGRWTYSITITHGLTSTTPPWIAFGRARAERKAMRKLARYQRDQARRDSAASLR